MIEKLNLRFMCEDTGYCRVYFHAEGSKKRVYCIQEEMADVFVFYRCTGQELEPDYAVKPEMFGEIEEPKGGDLSRRIAQWLKEVRQEIGSKAAEKEERESEVGS